MSQIIVPNAANNGPAKVQMPTSLVASTLPSYLAAVQPEDMGLDLMANYVKPPMLKIVQSMSPDALKDAFGEGAIVMAPSNICLSGKPSTNPLPLRVVPIFMYPEAIAWNPRGYGLPMFAMDSQNRVMRTTDVNSDLMRRARSMDRKLTEWPVEGAPADKPARLQEHINFIVMVEGVAEVEGLPIMISFSRMQHKHGKSWCNDLVTRRMHISSMYWHINVNPTKEKNQKGSWWGWEIRPETREDGLVSLVPEDWFNYYASKHAEFKQSWRDGLIQADFDEPEVEVPTTEQVAPAPNRF